MRTSKHIRFKSKPRYNVKLIRISKGLTIKDVATRVGISCSTLSRYERNPDTIPLSLAKTLLDYYDFPMDDCDFN